MKQPKEEEAKTITIKSRMGRDNQKRLHSEDVRMLNNAYGKGPALLLQGVQDFYKFYKHPKSHENLLRGVLKTIWDQGGHQDAYGHKQQPDGSMSSKRPSTDDDPYSSKKLRVQAPAGLEISAADTPQHKEIPAGSNEEPEAAIADEQHSTSLPTISNASSQAPAQTQSRKWTKMDHTLEYKGQWEIPDSTDKVQVWRWNSLRAAKFMEGTTPKSSDGVFDYYDGTKQPALELLPDEDLVKRMMQSRRWKDSKECLIVGFRINVNDPDAASCILFVTTS
jgi:hypothetical protein